MGIERKIANAAVIAAIAGGACSPRDVRPPVVPEGVEARVTEITPTPESTSTPTLEPTPDTQRQESISQLREMIDAYMNLNPEEIMEYVRQYGFLVPAGRGSDGRLYTPPSLGDNTAWTPSSRQGETYFVFPGIQPNLGVVSQFTSPEDREGEEWFIGRQSSYQGILLGTYATEVEGITYQFMIVGHLIGDEKFVLPYLLGTSANSSDEPFTASLSRATVYDWPPQQGQRIFHSETDGSYVPSVSENLSRIEGMVGRIVFFSIGVGTGNLSSVLNSFWETFGNNPELRYFLDENNPAFTEWRRQYAEQYEVANPERLTLYTRVGEIGELYFQDMRAKYLHLATSLGLGIRYDGSYAYHNPITPIETGYLQQISPEGLFNTTNLTHFDAWSYPFVPNIYMIQASGGGDPSLFDSR